MIHPIMARSFLLFLSLRKQERENNYFQSLRKSRVPHKKINFFIIIGGKKGWEGDVNSSISLEYSKIPRTPGAQRSSQESHEPFTDSIVNEPGGKDDNYRMRYSNEPENKGKERKRTVPINNPSGKSQVVCVFSN